jgi:hypothetical protein
MSCQNYNLFNNVSSIGDNYLINQLEDNIKSFLDWGFLNIGAFVNVSIPTSGLYGGTFSDLKITSQVPYKDGQVWQSYKKDWVWETGIVYNSFSPQRVSGIYVNNNFYAAPTGSGAYSYSINYPLGQIVFDKAIGTNSSVKAQYSYRWCQVYKSSTTPHWQELQELSYKPSSQINQKASGDYHVYAANRIQMPAIVIEPIARSFSQPWQLGATDFAIDQDLLIHVFTENAQDANKITDIIRLQKDKTIILYNINKVINSGVFPLNYDGSINNSGLCYPDLISNYRWHSCYFKEISVLTMESANKNLYWCTLRLTAQVII